MKIPIDLPIELEGEPFVFVFEGFVGEVDADQLTKIDHSNLYGEAVTVSALVNQLGLMAAEAEYYMDRKKVLVEIEEARLNKYYRKKAITESAKFTEGSIRADVVLDPAYQNAMWAYLEAQRLFKRIDSTYRGVKSKDNKLNNMIRGVTPSELAHELVEGKINNIFIKKRKSITDLRR